MSRFSPTVVPTWGTSFGNAAQGASDAFVTARRNRTLDALRMLQMGYREQTDSDEASPPDGRRSSSSSASPPSGAPTVRPSSTVLSPTQAPPGMTPAMRPDDSEGGPDGQMLADALPGPMPNFKGRPLPGVSPVPTDTTGLVGDIGAAALGALNRAGLPTPPAPSQSGPVTAAALGGRHVPTVVIGGHRFVMTDEAQAAKQAQSEDVASQRRLRDAQAGFYNYRPEMARESNQTKRDVAGTNASSRVTVAGIGADSRETVAGTNADSREAVAGTNATSRESVAGTRGKATVDAATVRANAGPADGTREFKALIALRNSVVAQIRNAEVNSFPPIDPNNPTPAELASERDKASLHQHLNEVDSRIANATPHVSGGDRAPLPPRGTVQPQQGSAPAGDVALDGVQRAPLPSRQPSRAPLPVRQDAAPPAPVAPGATRMGAPAAPTSSDSAQAQAALRRIQASGGKITLAQALASPALSDGAKRLLQRGGAP